MEVGDDEMINLCGADKEWVKETLEKAKNKIAFSTRQMGVRLPFTTIDGVYDDQYTTCLLYTSRCV